MPRMAGADWPTAPLSPPLPESEEPVSVAAGAAPGEVESPVGASVASAVGAVVAEESGSSVLGADPSEALWLAVASAQNGMAAGRTSTAHNQV